MASLDDIRAMKMNAIVGSGERLKDFVDMHYLLEHRNLEQMLKAYEAKYPDSTGLQARRALLYHEDISFNQKDDIVLMNNKFDWEIMTERLKKAVQDPKSVFEDLAKNIDDPEIKMGKSKGL